MIDEADFQIESANFFNANGPGAVGANGPSKKQAANSQRLMASNGVVGNQQPKRPILDNFQKPKQQKASENTGTFAIDGLNQVNNTSEYYNETESENNSKIRGGRHSI